MRLDEYLANEGLVTTRSRAKKLIERGQVKVDGKVVTKHSQKIEYGHAVTIEGEDRPEGYFKLKDIHERSGILHPGDVVLDIGSSAGGFLQYASAIAGSIVGIEFSEDFREQLSAVEEDNPNVKVVFDDAFKMDTAKLGGPYDVILNDMTVEPMMSVEALKRFLPLLKEHGRILQVVKLGPKGSPEPMAEKLQEIGLRIIEIIMPEKMEAYIIASK